ncbi:MAG: DegV family protein, partial [Acholeplasmataceae bacterium]|nr:DegV family protein [Acholeplasmataceae bacterium]
TIDPEIVVQALQDKKELKTSQPSPEAFMQAFQEQLKTYDEVLCMTLSKTLSGTLNSANLALTIAENEKVAVVDSETTINGGSYLTEKMLEFFDEGHSLKEGLKLLEDLKSKGSLVFTVDNLQTLVRNGRIGRVSAIIGNIMKVKPILRFKRGVLELEHKVRSFANVILYLVKEAEKLLPFGKVIVRIGYVDQSAKAKELEHEMFQLGENVQVSIEGVISPVVSAHVGLGGLGVYLAYE